MASIRKFRNKWRAEVQHHGQRLSKVHATEEGARAWAKFVEEQLHADASRFRPQDRVVPNGADLVTWVPTTVLTASREIPHSQAVVLAAAIPMSRASGVYFLFRNKEVVYVGQSVDVLHRIARHRREGKTFDAFAYMECDPSDLDRVESLYIKAFVPEENYSLGSARVRSRALGGCKPVPPQSPTADSVELT